MPTVSVQHTFTLALQHHQAGRLSNAEALYRQILAVQPEHADALHRLGIIALQVARPDLAVEWIRKALAANPNDPGAHTNLGEAYRMLEQPEAATAAYRRAIQLKPDLPEAHNNLAIVLDKQGQFDEAIAAYRRALQFRPDYPEASNNLGNALKDRGQLNEAIAAYRQALQLKPDFATAYYNLGNVLREQGRLDEAVVAYHRALQFQPDCPEFYNNLGSVLREQGLLDEAVAAYRRALQFKPDYPEAYSNLGVALVEQGKFEEAMVTHRQAIELKFDYPEAHYNLGVALAKRGRPSEAVTAYREALRFRSDYPEALINLSNALRDLGQIEEAVTAIRSALELKPDHPEAHNSLGAILVEQGQFDAAMAAYRRAVQLNPNYSIAKFNQSILLLLRGDFEHGWPLYEERGSAFRWVQRSFCQPRWDGSRLDGRRVLVHTEQGFGDELQFVRYAKLIAAHGGEVILECQRSLVELFRGVNGVSEVVAAGESLPPFDLHLPMLSQPLVFKTALETIPREVPYLFAEPARCEVWRERLGGDRSRLRVGLVWAGNPETVQLQKRHITLDDWLPLLRVEGVDFFSLQLGHGSEQIRQLSGTVGIIDHTGHIKDFADTAAFITQLDLIISVDTAAAHLAGALGRAVWTLLPFVPDWRWGLESEKTPWYPTMRLFRQPATGDWASVIQWVAVELNRAAMKKALEREL